MASAYFPESRARLILWLPFGLAWWLVQAALKLIVLIPGLVIVPFLYRYRFTDIKDMPWWSLPWVNPEDWQGGHRNYNGSIPTWWQEKERKPGVPYGESLYSFWRYHARRNPADGLRNFKWLQLWIKKEKVWYWTPELMEHYEAWYDRTPGWRGYIAGQSFWWGFKIQWVRKESYSEMKMGFRVEPRDAVYELKETSARRILGASFASKLIFHRELE